MGSDLLPDLNGGIITKATKCIIVCLLNTSLILINTSKYFVGTLQCNKKTGSS